ncbi:coenzyme-B sulfoethylthiotransferase subunit alpha, partial [Methanopyrus sp.]
MVERSKEEALFIKALKEKFEEDPEDKYTKFYVYGGYRQSPRKSEFKEWADKLADKLGIPRYNPDRIAELGGVPTGQRKLMSYQVSGTDVFVEGDDLHFVNNAAIQQMWYEIRRTVIMDLEPVHRVLERKFNKEITPETISAYMEVLNHTVPGGAVTPSEYLAETHPGVTWDAYAKVITGDLEMADEIDGKFVIHLEDYFPDDQVEQLSRALGDGVYQVVRVPTLVVMVCDGGAAWRWTAVQTGMALGAAYRLPLGNMAAGVADFAELGYAIKHAGSIRMAEMLPARRARGENEPGGIPFGVLADCVQTMRKYPDDPAKVALEVIGAAAALFDQVWLGSYQSGGVGFTQYATAVYTDNILDDYVYYGLEYVEDKYEIAGAEPSMDVVKDVATEVTLYGLEQYERYPAAMETHFGGSQRAAVCAAAAGCSVAFATGHAQAGLNGWYLSQILHKEGHGRLGFYGYDLQDQCGAANSLSVRSDEGLPLELRGPNYPNYAMNVGHLGEYAGIVQAA